MSHNVVVIGGGMGGLAIAARRAVRGDHVTLFEAQSHVGGKLATFEHNGFRFDVGPSILTWPDVFRKLWNAIGGDFDRELTPRRLDPIARYRFADGTWLDASADDAEFCEAVERLQVGNGDDMRRFLARAQKIWDATTEPFLQRPMGSPREFALLLRGIRDLPAISPHRSLRWLGRSFLRDERLVSFVDRYATYTGSDPRRAPAALAAIPWIERSGGGWYVPGGLHRIAESLLGHAQRVGVDVFCNTKVVAIRTEAGRARGVMLADGSEVNADVVIANGDARAVFDELVPNVETRGARWRVSRARATRAQPSLSGFVLCLGVRGRTPELAHHTVLFPATYDHEFDALFGDRPNAVDDPTIYVSVPNDPLVAPVDHEAWFVLVNAPRHRPGRAREGVDWDAPGCADRYADHILSVLATRGIDVRARVLFREIRTPADIERRTGAIGGSIYGTSSNGAVAAFLRPANRTPLKGLFLVGGSSHPGGGLPLVVQSAAIVSAMIDATTTRRERSA